MAGGRVVEFFTTQPVRVSALLRLPLIGLIVVLVSVWDVDHWLPVLYAVILSVYTAVAVLWLERSRLCKTSLLHRPWTHSMSGKVSEMQRTDQRFRAIPAMTNVNVDAVRAC